MLLVVLSSLLLPACKDSSSSSLLSSSSVSTSTSPSSSSAYLASSPVISSSSFKSALTKKEVTTYVLTNDGIESQSDNLYFVDGQGDIPFLCLNETLSLLQRSLADSTLTAEGKIITIGRSENPSTITFNFAKRTVAYSDLDLYAANHGKVSVLNLVSDFGETKEGKPRYLESQTSKGFDYYRAGMGFTLELAKWNIPLYYEEDKGYIPVQTFTDLVLSERNIVLACNSQNLFMSGAVFSSEMLTEYYSVTPTKRSAEIARFSRDELALALDLQYGLKEEHAITDFASFFQQTGIDEKLLSTDPLVADQGVYQLCAQALGDFHSSFLAASPYVGADKLDAIKKAGLSSPNYQEFMLIRYAFQTARSAVISALSGGEKTAFAPYEEYGDTAFVTFDHFTGPGQDYYTQPATAESTDTFGIIEYAHSQIFKTGSKIKKVVLDLSCNGGGALNAGAYTAGWFLPYAILNAQDPLTGAQGSFTYASDVDMNGVYDEADRLSKLQLYCLISPASFSCANAVAAAFKDSDQVRLLGRRSSGGGAVVQNLSLADGTLFQTSGNRVLSSVHNGAFTSVDDGVDVDFSLDTYLDFYNRAALTTKIAAL